MYLVVNRNDPHWCYACEHSEQAAEERLIKARLEHPNQDYVVMTDDDWYELNRKIFLDSPMEEITEEKYYEMLDVLPPLHYYTINGISEFCMSEMTWGHFTTQCAHDPNTGKYWWKTVDAYDRSTWIDHILTT